MRTGSKRVRRRKRRRGGAIPILLLSALLAACVHGVGSRLLKERDARARMAALQERAAGGAEIVWIELAPERAQAETVALVAPLVLEPQTAAPLALEPQTAALPSETPVPVASGAVAPTMLGTLSEENADFVGWLRLPGTQVDYPVMQSPDRPHYYLRRDFYGERSKSGLPFIDEACDLAGDRSHLIIYGHNMKDGSMFGELKRLLDPDFYRSHRTLTFDTPEEARTYEIVSVYLMALDPDAAFKFYRYPNFKTEADFQTYAEHALANAVHPPDTPLAYGDALITLVTCSNHAEQGRLIAVAKRI